MRFRVFFIPLIVFISVVARSETYNLKHALSQANAEETKDLPKLLTQMRTTPTDSPSVMKVTEVKKGSLFDRLGIKVGDLILTGQNPASKKPMKLQHKIHR